MGDYTIQLGASQLIVPSLIALAVILLSILSIRSCRRFIGACISVIVASAVFTCALFAAVAVQVYDREQSALEMLQAREQSETLNKSSIRRYVTVSTRQDVPSCFDTQPPRVIPEYCSTWKWSLDKPFSAD